MTSESLNYSVDTAASSTNPSAVLSANRAVLLLLLVPTVVAVVAGGFEFANANLILFIGTTGTLVLLGLMWRTPLRALLAEPWMQRGPKFGIALGLTALAMVAAEGILFFIVWVAPGLIEVIPQLLVQSSSDWVWMVVNVIVLIPLCEELVFRGLASRAYGGVRSPRFALFFTAGLFALVHGSPAHVLAILPLALILGLAVHATGSFWTAVLVHSLYNAGAVGLAQFGLYDANAIPVRGIIGLIAAALATFLALKWLGLPASQPSHHGKLWSASLVVVVALSILSLVFIGVVVFTSGGANG